MAARVQKHHITYKPVEWEVELKMSWHRVISRIQITRATPEQYRLLINFIHSLTHECNRMRKELDTGLDLRDIKGKPPKREKIPIVPKGKDRGGDE